MFEKFEKVGRLNILVIGDIILDKYIYGDTTRISPEAPVPIVLSQRKSNVLGGAGNVAANLKALGAKAYLMGTVGNDSDGDLVIDLAKENLLNHSGILRSTKVTTVKTRIVSKGQQMLRIDSEDIDQISKKEEDLFLDKISRVIRDNDINALVLQDYNKGLLTSSLIDRIIILANELQLPYYVDPKHENFWRYKGAILFKPNLSELKKANFPYENELLDSILSKTAERLDCKILMCTLAEEGILYIENGKTNRMPTQKIDVRDVSGAGDTALSIMVIAHLLGYDTKSISKLANLCGQIVCMKSGVSTTSITELIDAYNSNYNKSD